MIRPTLFIIVYNWLFIDIRKMVDTIFVLRTKLLQCSGDNKIFILFFI